MTKKTFTVEDVAALSGSAATTVLTWIRKKKLRAHKVRSYAIDGAEVLRFLLAANKEN